MNILNTLRSLNGSRKTLRRKLLRYMFTLAVLLLAALAAGLLLLGRFKRPGEETAQTLTLQMEFFEKNMQEYFEQLAAAGIDLSEDITETLESYLKKNSLDMDDLSGTGRCAAGIQKKLLPMLSESIRLEDCSGGFIILNAPETYEKSDSAPGIYIMKEIVDSPNPQLLLYRGLARTAEEENIALHRKFRQEFDLGKFSGYSRLLSRAKLSLIRSYHLTDMLTLPGTDEQVYLMTVPMVGEDGTVYGLCGFEVSRRYFRSHFAQPSNLSHLACMLTPADAIKTDGKKQRIISADSSMDCGIGYVIPKGDFTISGIGNGLKEFSGDISYVGLQRRISISFQDAPYMMTVMIPKTDYDRMARTFALQIILLILLLAFFVIATCLYFSRRYVAPLLRSLDQMKQKNYQDAKVDIPEMDALSDFMQERSDAHQEELNDLTQQKQAAEKEAARLAYSRKTEIDPQLYEYFLKGLKTLTPTEKKVLDMYVDGMGTREVLTALGIKESTLRFHNKNIYSKLGVNSKKQAVLYASVARKNLWKGP